MITVAFKIEKHCKHVIRYVPVDETAAAAITNLYVDKAALGQLGAGAAPERITVTISAGGES